MKYTYKNLRVIRNFVEHLREKGYIIKDDDVDSFFEGESELTKRQKKALEIVKAGVKSTTEVAEEMGVNLPTAQGFLQVLFELGHVAKKKNPENRRETLWVA